MSVKIPLFQIDAFTDEAFKGNPAAICILDKEVDDKILQKIAAEMNLSETAFLYVSKDYEINKQDSFRLRWFTPKVEVNLCGHATLATAALLFFHYNIKSTKITFKTKSGDLVAIKEDDTVVLDFPMNKPQDIAVLDGLKEALRVNKIVNCSYSNTIKDLLIEVENHEVVQNLNPSFSKLLSLSINLDIRGIMVTSRGFQDYDFVSRFFAPWVGINEDPVTGSAHTILGPYWYKKIGKKEMKAAQLSDRGGETLVRLIDDNRVELEGKSKLILEGFLHFKV